MLERIGSSDAIRYMVQDCGMTLQDASIKTGKQKGSLSTRLHNNTRFTIDEFVKICDACGWQFDLRGIDENKPREDVKTRRQDQLSICFFQ